MAFKSFLNFKYSNTHENRIWNKLVGKLKDEYDTSEYEVYLVGNLLTGGKELDALLVKDDAVIVIDFKDYGGSLSISENEPWMISGTEINPNRKNPYKQLSDNKYAVLSTLKKSLPDGFENWINIGHINALALFHQNIDYDLEKLPHDLSHSASRWFSVCDFSHFINHINEITSNQTLIRGERAEFFFRALGIRKDNFLDIDIASESQLVGPAPDEFKPLVQEESFSELYYRTASEMETIKLLVVGQDPYPTGSNGVAFCKDSYYSLYVEEPETSGSIVLKSMGLDMIKARQISWKNPKTLFLELLTKFGICFINVYNEPLDKIDMGKRRVNAAETYRFNLPIVKRAEKIVLLGKGITKNTFEEYYEGITYDHIFIHPSLSAKQSNPSEWAEIWETNTLEKLKL